MSTHIPNLRADTDAPLPQGDEPMSYTKHLVPEGAMLPATLELSQPYGRIAVIVDDSVDRPLVDLSTSGAPDGPAVEAIANAHTEEHGDTFAVIVPEPAPTTMRVGGAATVCHGGVNMGVIATGGTVYMSGNRATVVSGGAVITGGTTESIHTRVWIPAGSTVRVDSIAARVSTRGSLAALSGSTVSGDLDIDISEHLTVGTVSGAVRFGPTRQAQVSTTSGDIAALALGGTAHLQSVSGDITIHATADGSVTAATTSGDIRLTGMPDVTLKHRARSISGRVTDNLHRGGESR